MFGFFERQRLVKRGFAASKQRRRRTENEFLQTLENGWWTKIAIFAAFLIGLWIVMGSSGEEIPREKIIISLLIVVTSVAWLWINHLNIFERNSRLGLIYGVLLGHLAIVKFVLT